MFDPMVDGTAYMKSYTDNHPSGMLEAIDDFKYDTKQYIDNETTRIVFFTSSSRATAPIQDTNMDVPSMLPNPCAMLVREICITGITKPLVGGVMQLTIGNKRYKEVPLLWFYLHNVNAWTLRVPLFIGPLQLFKVELSWKLPVKTKRHSTTLRCAMFGEIARAVC